MSKHDEPKSDWNNDSLIQAAEQHENPHKGRAASLCVQRLKETTTVFGKVKKSYVVTTGDGHWGRGKTPREAARTAKASGARIPSPCSMHLVLNDEEPEVSSFGSVVADSVATIIHIGNWPRLQQLYHAAE